jgi:hypothetical protein
VRLRALSTHHLWATAQNAKARLSLIKRAEVAASAGVLLLKLQWIAVAEGAGFEPAGGC